MANILVVGPHPDDQELGMGGAIASLAAQGHNILLLDITDGEPTPHGSPEIRAKEAAQAAAILSPPSGQSPVRRLQLGLRNRYVEHSIENRHKLAGVIRAHQAQILFAPYPEDAHPDHRAVTRLVEDARFDAKLTKIDIPSPPGMELGPPIYPKWLFYYYATHLRICPQPGFLLDISAHLDTKLAACAAYRSQFEVNPRNRAVLDWIRAQAIYLGSRIDTPAAEGFWTPEPLGLSGFSDLIMQGR